MQSESTFERRVGEVVVDGGVCLGQVRLCVRECGARLGQVLVDGLLAGPVVALGYHVHTADLDR